MDKNKIKVGGLGIGPFNLSFSALSFKIDKIQALFFDKEKQFNWHSGLLLLNSNVQVFYLKDLVTFVDPCSNFSFLNFLKTKKRLYQFINLKKSKISRKEFNQYFQWVSEQITTLMFDEEVYEANFNNNNFVVRSSKNLYHFDHIILGTGLSPCLPNWVNKNVKQVYHSSEYCKIKDILKKRIIVVGSGQSGAEIMNDIIDNNQDYEEITWIMKDIFPVPLDETSFANELFTPGYSRYYNSLELSRKVELLAKCKYLSNGISSETLSELYNKLYLTKFYKNDKRKIKLMPSCEVVNMIISNNTKRLEILKLDTKTQTFLEGDVIIFCTGYKYSIPKYLSNLKSKINWCDKYGYKVKEDYSIEWEHENTNKIFIQSGIQLQKGIAENNFSLTAYRNAKIINSILEYDYYNVDEYETFLDFLDINIPNLGFVN